MRLIASLVAASFIASAVHAQPVGTWTRLSAAGGPNGATFCGMYFDTNRGILVAWDDQSRWIWDGQRWLREGFSLGFGNLRGAITRQVITFSPKNNAISVIGAQIAQYYPIRWSVASYVVSATDFSGLSFDSLYTTASAEAGSAAAAINPANGIAVAAVFPSLSYYQMDVLRPEPGSFRPLATTANPSIRSQAALAYDRVLSEYVLFGGNPISPISWAYGNDDWYVTAFTGPAPRYGHSMAFDASRGRTIMFGGITNGTLDNTDMYAWEWDGIAWIRGSAGPVPRMNAAMVYDSANSRILMFGGSPIAEPSATMTDLWEYRVATAPRMLNQPRRVVALEGEPVRMEITLAPDATLRQARWRRAGSALPDAPGYVGTATPALWIESAKFGDAGAYEFLIRNNVGTAISDPIFVEVLCRADADRSGFVDSDDFVAFTEAFERGCVSVGFGAELPDPECRARGDFDYSGFVDSDDFIGYVEAFSNGC